MTSTRHKWGEKIRFEHKSEQQCARCETIKVGRKEFQGGREIFWTEFYRDQERIRCEATPPCDARAEIGENA